ncbi:hypothetical protein BH18THE2_BH18THE2_03110 [soil metagenome]
MSRFIPEVHRPPAGTIHMGPPLTEECQSQRYIHVINCHLILALEYIKLNFSKETTSHLIPSITVSQSNSSVNSF